MLNFAEQTGSGAVTVVWSFLQGTEFLMYIKFYYKSVKTYVTAQAVRSVKQKRLPVTAGHLLIVE